jgi:hypothetical protein
VEERPCKQDTEHSGSLTYWDIFELAEQLVPSQKGLNSMG